MNYELRRSKERFGLIGSEVELEIESLASLDHTIDQMFEELEKTGNQELLGRLCPYFGELWPSARALAGELAARASEVRGKSLIELGCGLAVPSLVASRLGARVVATDFHPDAPRFLRSNLELNHLDIEYAPIDWADGMAAEFPFSDCFDIVIASDVLYEKEHGKALSGMIERALKPDGRVWIADPARPYLQLFLDEMSGLGFERLEKVINEVFVFEFRR